jgi:uncharacterized protein YhaN
MKVDGWHIDGFGVHADQTVEHLADGLTVVHGPNESGKTTLQHFLVGMLFGFPPSNRAGYHAPLRGGAFGGQLFVEDGHGRRLTIHRGSAKSSLRITGPDGPVPEGELADLLGGATRDLFQSIFAVHSTELAELKALTDDQVRDRVFSAGIVGAGRTAQQALAQLAEGRDALLKPRGRGDSYRLKQLRTDLVAARAQLHDARRRAEGLPSLVRQLDLLADQASRLSGEAEALRAERALLAAVRDLWPDWAEAERARRSLRDLGPVAPLAAEARDRLHRAVDRHTERTSLLAQARAAVGTVLERRQALPAPGATEAVAEDIAALAADANAEAARRDRAVELDQRIGEREADLAELLARLGPGCDEAWLAGQRHTVEAAAELRHQAEAAATARSEARALAQRLADAEREAAEEEAALAAAERDLAARTGPSLDEAQAGLDAARRVAQLVDRREAALHQLETARAWRVPTATAHAPAGAPGVPGWLTPSLLALAVVALVGAGLAVATGAVAAGIASLLAAAGAGAAGLALRSPAAHPHHEVGTGAAAEPTEATSPMVEVAEAELTRIEADLGPLLPVVGRHAAPTPAEAEAIRAAAERVHAQAQATANDRALVAARRRDQQERLAHRLTALRDEHEAGEARAAGAEAAWTAWLAERAMPTALGPSEAQAFLEAVDRAQAVARSLATHRADRAEAARRSAAFAERVATVRAQLPMLDAELARTLGSGAEPTAVVAQLVIARDRDRRRAQEIELAERDLAAATEAAQQAEARHAEAEAELQAALVAVGATDVDGALATLERAAAAHALVDAVERADESLATAVGRNAERLARARALLDAADPTGWDAQLAHLDHELARVGDERDQAIAARRDAQREIEDLQRSADVPTWELRVADLEAQLVEGVNQWAALTVAHRLVEGTLARYQRERQPDVVRRAAELFRLVTDGRYPRLEVHGTDIVAIDQLEGEVPAGSLSQGTVEQLYLCMRFALAESFSKTAPLPLLLDDVTVNADGGRLPRIAEVIADVAAHHQVLVFTCHHHTVERLRAAVPGATVLELPSSIRTRSIGLAAG